GQLATKLDSGLVAGVAAGSARRAENRNGGADLREGFKGIDEFGHDAENAPRIFFGESERLIVHARKIGRAQRSDKRGAGRACCQRAAVSNSRKAHGAWSKGRWHTLFTVTARRPAESETPEPNAPASC